MRIGVDARLCGERHAGIGRYVKNLIARLPFVLPEVNWVYFFYDREAKAEVLALVKEIYGEQGVSDFDARVKIAPAPVKHYTLAEQIKMPRIFAREKLDLLHVPHFNVALFYRGRTVITIHDLLWHEMGGGRATTLSPLKYHLKHIFYRLITGCAVKKAARIFVPAKIVKKTILKYYPHVANKIEVAYNGVSLPRRGSDTPQFKKHLPNEPYLLYVGSLYPHKNIDVVLQALRADQNLRLVLAGARDIFVQEVEAKVKTWHLSPQVTFLGRVSDDELAFLYQNCQALVQPSLSEGFGLTGIEAMSLGALVLASDIEVFHEVYRDNFIPFQPRQKASFLQAVAKLKKINRPVWLERGKKLAATYNWDEMVKKVTTAYVKILR